MRFAFWKTRKEPAVEEEAPPAPSPPVAEVEPEPAPEPEPELQPETAPTRLELTIDEAKDAIREAGGDVIQVGFLASAYRRHAQEDPTSGETAASRKKLRDLVGKRLKDRGLLAADGILELRD